MSEYLSGSAGLNTCVSDTNNYAQSMQEHASVFDRLRNKWASIVAIGVAVTSMAFSPAGELAAHAEETKQAVVGMPFDGKWAYSNETSAGCGPGNNQTSHPSCHESYYRDWGTDIYASAGTEVKLKVSGDNLTFDWGTANGTCGESRMVKVKKDTTEIGSIYFTHLSSAASTKDSPKEGMTIGKIANLTCNPGGSGKHIHIEMGNTSNTKSCYIDYSNKDHTAGMSVDAGKPIGILGSNSTVKEACSSVSNVERPTSPTTLPWIFENMEGDPGSMSTFNADTGRAPAAVQFNGQLYVLSYEATGGNLRLAKTTPTWNFSTLDGTGGGNGRKDADVGRTPSLVVAGKTLHAFYHDAGGGNLRHGLTQDGVNWRLEDLDGTLGSVLGRNRNLGQTPSAVVMPDGTIHVAYRDADYGNLILATALPGRGWTSTVLEGDPNSVSRKDGDIGYDPVLVNYRGVLHVFHYNASGGNLRHAWRNGTWRFEDLDGTPNSVCGKDGNIGKNPVALVQGNTLQVFASDEGNQDLRHYWSGQDGWHCETLEGDANAVLGEGETGGEVGAMPSFVSVGGQLHGFAKETKWGSLRHYWTDSSGWHSENFDGLGGNPAGRVNHSTGDDPVVVPFGTTPQVFWWDNTVGDLRHGIPLRSQ